MMNFCVKAVSVLKNFLFCTLMWVNVPFFLDYWKQFKTCSVNVCEVVGEKEYSGLDEPCCW